MVKKKKERKQSQKSEDIEKKVWPVHVQCLSTQSNGPWRTQKGIKPTEALRLSEKPPVCCSLAQESPSELCSVGTHHQFTLSSPKLN